MAKKITITLSQKSIQDAIGQIKAYKNDLAYKCQLLAEKLAERGVEIARLQLSDLDAVFTTELISSIHAVQHAPEILERMVRAAAGGIVGQALQP